MHGLNKLEKNHGERNQTQKRKCIKRVKKVNGLIHVYNTHQQPIHFLLSADEDLRLMGDGGICFSEEERQEGWCSRKQKIALINDLRHASAHTLQCIGARGTKSILHIAKTRSQAATEADGFAVAKNNRWKHSRNNQYKLLGPREWKRYMRVTAEGSRTQEEISRKK